MFPRTNVWNGEGSVGLVTSLYTVRFRRIVFTVGKRIFFSPKRTDILFIEHRCFSFFAGEAEQPKRKHDHHYYFVTKLRMNGALPLLIFYDFVTHTQTVFSVPFVLYD